MSYVVSLAGGVATIALNKSPGIDNSLAEILVNNISYQNANTDPLGPAGSRVITLSQLKDSGGRASNGADTSTLSLVSTVTVLAANQLPVGSLLVSGSAQVNGHVYADMSQVTDADGLGDVTYQWQSAAAGTGVWTDLAGTQSVYRLTANEVGQQIRVKASYTDGRGHRESLIATLPTVAADSTSPAFKQLRVDGSSVSLEFNETLDSLNALDTSYMTVRKGDSQAFNAPVFAVGNAGMGAANALKITLDSNEWNTATGFQFDYSAPADQNATGLLSDSAANHAGSFHVFLYRGDTADATGHTDENDVVMGGAGNDTIHGGMGNDVMWGLDSLGTVAASDNDSFIWALGDAGASGATDTVKDFTPYTNGSGDKLDISGLLQGYLQGSLLTDWVKSVATAQMVNGVANCTVISIDVDGSGSGEVKQTIVLENVNLLSGLSGTLEQQLQALKTSGVIVA